MAFHHLERLTFLIIDDDPDELRLLEKLVTMLGVRRVKRAADGAEALEILRLIPVHMIICDLCMTPMDGLDFVRELRRLRLRQRSLVPVIMTTGHTETENIAAARDAGATEVLAKPFTPMQLYRRIVAITAAPRTFVSRGAFKGPDRRRRHQEVAKRERRHEWQPEAIEQVGRPVF